MNTRVQIKELALTVGRGLKDYIAIHNKIQQKSATRISSLMYSIGLGTPMAKLLAEAESLVPIWDGIAEKVEAFKATAYDSLPPDQRSYLDILIRYVASVGRTVDALVSRQRLLNEKSKGGANNAISLAAYLKLETEYQAAISDYTAIGQELMSASRIIF